MGATEMRVLLPTYGSPRGDVEPLLEVMERSLGFGAEACVCSSPDCAVRLAEVKVPLVPAGASR